MFCIEIVEKICLQRWLIDGEFQVVRGNRVCFALISIIIMVMSHRDHTIYFGTTVMGPLKWKVPVGIVVWRVGI